MAEVTQQSYELAQAYITALTGSVDTVMEWRALSDVEPGAPGQVARGSLAQCWEWLCAWNAAKHGIFVIVAETDGQGRTLEHVTRLRASYVDHDGQDATQQAERAAQATPAPAFAVNSSPGKFHTYWLTEPHGDKLRFTMVQRRLAVLFHGDSKVNDPTRVLRVPGFWHQKGTPHLVTCWALPGMGQPTTIDALDAATAHVVVPDGGTGERKPLGEGAQAPSIEWLERALVLSDPNEMDRLEWVAFTSAWKQAGWTLADDDTLKSMWLNWCTRYHDNQPRDNEKQWRSIRDSELDWKSICKRVPSLQAALSFGQPQESVPAPNVPPMPPPQPPALDCSGEYLTHLEQQTWFSGCTFIVTMAQILGPDATFYNQAAFNATFGGKYFIIDGDGKKTDEPWKAATRSTLWRIPRVHHIRFLPQEEPGTIVTDALGRTGVNMYVPPVIERTPGDPSPFLNHIAAIIPDEGDRKILFDWMAHIVKFPGFKIPWAPVIQSAEGIGKGVIKDVMTYAVGLPYVHYPNAQELADSGGKFNGWMRNKVFILADEIKVDEKRHMVEVLKPLVSEKMIEVQSKGIDQKMEDNPACWAFFSNYKDAVPVSKNGRRYAIFYSPLQTEAMLLARGMGDDYMKSIFNWLQSGGLAIVADWLHNYPIERGAIPMRAPKTTSWDEAVSISLSPIERVVQEAVADGVVGFRGGWISSLAVLKRCRETGAVKGNILPTTIASILEGMGYVEIGRADRPYMQESADTRATLYAKDAGADVAGYGPAQGYV